ncbi:MAG: InlB B-repeat-containing protein [Solobacterium sp.]|nr:InlB B-repeat-containing protein [Solobacterium sp.]
MNTSVYAEESVADDHGASKYNLTLNADKSEEMCTEVYTSTDADDTSLYSYGNFNDAGEGWYVWNTDSSAWTLFMQDDTPINNEQDSGETYDAPVTIHVSSSGDDSAARAEGAVYATLQGAVDAAESNDVIAIDEDITLNDTVTIDGKALTVRSDGKMIKRNTFTDAMIAFKNSANVTISNVIIDGNNTVNSIKSPLVCYSSTLTLKEGTVVQNSVVKCNGSSDKYGGGVTVTGSENRVSVLNIDGASVINNQSTFSGGGVSVYTYGTVNLISGSISNNSCSVNAGGVYVNSRSTMYMTGGEISGNHATGPGGGVSISAHSVVVQSGGSVSQNTSDAYGGGYDVFSGEGSGNGDDALTLSGDALVTGNSATSGGGGLIVWQHSTVNIMDNATISDNSSGSDSVGGGIWLTDSAVANMSGGTISGNTADNGGAFGIFGGGTLNMTGGNITGNIGATGMDSGIYIGGGSTANLLGGSIKDNAEATRGMTATVALNATLNLGDLDCNGDIYLAPKKDDTPASVVNLVKKTDNDYLISTKSTDQEDGRIIVVPGSVTVGGTTYAETDTESVVSHFSHVTKGVIKGSEYDAVNDTGDLVLKGYQLTFDTVQPDAAKIDPVNGNDGDKIVDLLPEDPTLEGYTFQGWYLDAEYATKLSDTDVLKANTTLYAKWNKNPDPVPPAAPTATPSSSASASTSSISTTSNNTQYLVTFLDCKGNTVKVEWVTYQGSATAPVGFGSYTGYTNVSANIDLKPSSCSVNNSWAVPKTSDKTRPPG